MSPVYTATTRRQDYSKQHERIQTYKGDIQQQRPEHRITTRNQITTTRSQVAMLKNLERQYL
jgi:hypothetical protein